MLTSKGIAISAQPFLLQATLWDTELNTALINITAERAIGLASPHNPHPGHMINASGTLGGYNWLGGHNGFPDALYPRSSIIADTPPKKVSMLTPNYIQNNMGVLLGPFMVNSTYYMLSFTLPIFGTTVGAGPSLLGFITVVAN